MTENTQAHKTRNMGNCYKLFHVLECLDTYTDWKCSF